MIKPKPPRVLVVLAHFDETRNPRGRPDFIPQGVGHAFLAGAFDRNFADVRIYSEFCNGPLMDEALLAWPDMLVLTGVTSSFDRMCHLTAYVRTKSPNCVVVAGGPAVRNLPISSARFFDYVCNGDVEELQLIAREVFGEHAASTDVLPRFDLLNWRSPVNYVESSRYCNFKCSFCALTGEGRSYRTYDLKYVEAQIRAAPANKYLLFIDNNFYGNNRSAFLAKLDLLKSLWREGLFKGWIALVTADFFKEPDNLVGAREAGCIGLFSGVESLNDDQLKRYGKKQNLVTPQLDSIRRCLKAGVVFQYGLIFDPSTQTLEAMRDEIAFITGDHSIPLPAFLSLTIPLLGTPYFHECVANRRFLPSAKLRDMDGFTLLTHPLDPLDHVVRFTQGLSRLEGNRYRILRHCLGFYANYRSTLSGRQMVNLLANSFRLTLPSVIHEHRIPSASNDTERLTYVTTNQPLGPLYSPFLAVPERFRGHFAPTMITDEDGELDGDLARNLEVQRTLKDTSASSSHPITSRPSA